MDNFSLNPIDVVEEVIYSKKWTFSRADDYELVAEIASKWCQYRFYFTWSEQIRAISLTVTFDLKFPQNRKSGKDGSITFVNSPTFFLNRGHLTLIPEIGSIFLFPSYVLHTVYPIRENQEERRCIAFNASLLPSPKI